MAIGTGLAILGSAALGAGASILGGRAQERAARRGAEAITGTQREQFQATREDLAPFREIGAEAAQTLGGLLGEGGELRRTFTGEDLAQDPGFQFRLGAGTQALQRSAAAGGRLTSGQTGKELVQFGQELGSQEFGRAFERFRSTQGDLFNRLFSVSEAGRGAAGATGQFGAQAATRIGEAQAGREAATGQARSGVFTNLANIGTSAFENLAFQGLANQPTAQQTFTGGDLNLQPELRTSAQRRITF